MASIALLTTRACCATLVVGAVLSAAAFGQIVGQPVVNPTNGHQYWLLGPSTWTAGESMARLLGGHLATVNDAEENAWITAAFPQALYIWIGLNDVETEGDFVWSSGEDAGYRNWFEGEPNNAGGEEQYVQIYNFDGGLRRWNDGGDVDIVSIYPVYAVAEIDVPMGDAIAWDFRGSGLPAGWSSETHGGTWSKSKFGQTFQGIAAFPNSSPLYEDPPGSQPQMLIDAWSPEFRFTSLEQAEFRIDLSAAFSVESAAGVRIELYKITGPAFPTASTSGLASVLEVDLQELADAPGEYSRKFLPEVFGEAPDGHEDNKSVYRIRTRVWDGDTDPGSIGYVHMKGFSITHTTLNRSGDYNADGVVDGSDLLVWQRQLGGSVGISADGDGSFIVDAGDLHVWRNTFGESRAAVTTFSLGDPGSAVPEPIGSALASIGVICTLVRRRRR